jgi:enediyne biosynthesis protein E4
MKLRLIKTGIYFFLLLIFTNSCKHGPASENSLVSDKSQIKLFDILMPEKTGINFENKLTESLTMNGLYYEYYYNGAGLSVADFNNDGLQDVYFISNLYPDRKSVV